MSRPRPPRSHFHHLTGQQLSHLERSLAVCGLRALNSAARKYGLTKREIIEAVARYRGERYKRTPRSQR